MAGNTVYNMCHINLNITLNNIYPEGSSTTLSTTQYICTAPPTWQSLLPFIYHVSRYSFVPFSLNSFHSFLAKYTNFASFDFTFIQNCLHFDQVHFKDNTHHMHIYSAQCSLSSISGVLTMFYVMFVFVLKYPISKCKAKCQHNILQKRSSDCKRRSCF